MSGSNDLISDYSPESGSGFGGSTLTPADPLLTPLGPFGGPTQTMALMAGSPALGMGITAYHDYPTDSVPITTDQRGKMRHSSGAAVGAFETAVTSYTVTDNGDGAGTSSDVTLRYAIDHAVAFGEMATVGFDLAAGDRTITLANRDTSPANVYGDTALVVDGADIIVDGAAASGLVIGGNNMLRPFAVTGTSSLTVENLMIAGGVAAGGAGGRRSDEAGGGGGAGLGGAVYDDGGAFTAEGVTFTNNVARGGGAGPHQRQYLQRQHGSDDAECRRERDGHRRGQASDHGEYPVAGAGDDDASHGGECGQLPGFGRTPDRVHRHREPERSANLVERDHVVHDAVATRERRHGTAHDDLRTHERDGKAWEVEWRHHRQERGRDDPGCGGPW